MRAFRMGRLYHARAPAATIAFRVKDPLVGSPGCHRHGHPGRPLRAVPIRRTPRPQWLHSPRSRSVACGADRASWRRLLPASALFFAGALSILTHTPRPAPRLDADGREVVILGGCVVEPPAVSGERERFLLELDRMRARRSRSTPSRAKRCRRCTTARTSSSTCEVRPPRNFGNPGRVRLRDVSWPAGYLLDRSGAARRRARSAGPLRIALSESRDGPAPGRAGPHRAPLSRRPLPQPA